MFSLTGLTGNLFWPFSLFSLCSGYPVRFDTAILECGYYSDKRNFYFKLLSLNLGPEIIGIPEVLSLKIRSVREIEATHVKPTVHVGDLEEVFEDVDPDLCQLGGKVIVVEKVREVAQSQGQLIAR